MPRSSFKTTGRMSEGPQETVVWETNHGHYKRQRRLITKPTVAQRTLGTGDRSRMNPNGVLQIVCKTPLGFVFLGEPVPGCAARPWALM